MMNSKPQIVYVDEGHHNGVVFEALIDAHAKVHVFHSAMLALSRLSDIRPDVVVCDHHLSDLPGLKFLDVVKRVCPETVRVLVSKSPENPEIFNAIKAGEIFDATRKPWEGSELEKIVLKAIHYRRSHLEAQRFHTDLIERNKVLDQLVGEMKTLLAKEQLLREELERWIPPFMVKSIQEGKPNLTTEKDLVVTSFQLIDSHRWSEIQVRGASVKTHVLSLFTEALIKNGGWLQSHSGDGGVGHFGLMETSNPYEAALAAVREFRVSLRSLNDICGLEVECGLAVHVAKNCPISTLQVGVHRGDKDFTQKSIGVASRDVDLALELSELTIDMPGTNIVLTQDFIDGLKKDRTAPFVAIGAYVAGPGANPMNLMLITSDKIQESHVIKLRGKLTKTSKENRHLRLVA